MNVRLRLRRKSLLSDGWHTGRESSASRGKSTGRVLPQQLRGSLTDNRTSNAGSAFSPKVWRSGSGVPKLLRKRHAELHFQQLLWELARGGVEFVDRETLLRRFSGVIEAAETDRETSISSTAGVPRLEIRTSSRLKRSTMPIRSTSRDWLTKCGRKHSQIWRRS